MASIYLGNEDRNILIDIKNKLDNKNEIELINKLLKKEEESRTFSNKVAREYKRKKRAENKDYARSKKEISERKDRK